MKMFMILVRCDQSGLSVSCLNYHHFLCQHYYIFFVLLYQFIHMLMCFYFVCLLLLVFHIPPHTIFTALLIPPYVEIHLLPPIHF